MIAILSVSYYIRHYYVRYLHGGVYIAHTNVGQLLYLDCITVEDLSNKKNLQDLDGS